MKDVWKSWGARATMIVALTIITYIPAIRDGFVFDDPTLITENALVRANDGLYQFWFTTAAPDYYPVTWSLWWLEWRLWGANPAGYHVVNILMHAANAMLVWVVLGRLKIPGAWLAGVLFAVHPVNAATVAWISEQKNTLSMLFYGIAALLYLQFDDKAEWNWYVLALAAFLLAVLSKASVVMLPVVLLGCVWWRHRSLRWRDVWLVLPFLALALVFGLITVWFQNHRVAEGHIVRIMSFSYRLAVAGWIPWFYLYKAFVPVNLTLNYPKWDVDPTLLISYLPGLVLIATLAVFWWKRQTWGRPLLFASVYFVAMLFPVAGFLDQGFYQYSLVADHWQYLAIVAPIACVAALGAALLRRGKVPASSISIGIVVALLVVASWRRAAVYADDETLWRDNLAKNPRSWLAHTNLGVEMEVAGRANEARRHYEAALQINPDYAAAHYNLARILWRENDARGAIEHWKQALLRNPDLAEAHYSLGVALRLEGKTEDAAAHWEQAVRLDPDYFEAQVDLGGVRLEQGRIREAIDHYQEALRVKPDFAEVYYNLGIALEQAGRKQEAADYYRQAVRIKSNYVEARERLMELESTP